MEEKSEERQNTTDKKTSIELVNLVREEFETRGLESHKRVKQAKKNDEEVY